MVKAVFCLEELPECDLLVGLSLVGRWGKIELDGLHGLGSRFYKIYRAVTGFGAF